MVRFLYLLLLWPMFVWPAEPGVPVTLVSVHQGEIREIVRVPALIEARNAPLLHGKVSAEVVDIRVDEGDTVRKGQLLARLDDEGFRLDRKAVLADIARLEATLANQQLTLKRDQRLFTKGLVPDTRLDASRTAVKQTRAALAHARALLEKADYQLSHTRILSPIDGVVQQRLVSVGDYLNPMSPASKALFRIVDTHHLRARLYFPDTLAERLKPGLPVILDDGRRRLETRLDKVLPVLEDASRALVALADFDNTADWPPGLHLNADVALTVHRHALLVPDAVLVQRPAGIVAYRLREDDRVEAVPVVTGIRRDGQVEILSGLAAGDQVVLDGAAYLSDGARVSVKAPENTQ